MARNRGRGSWENVHGTGDDRGEPVTSAVRAQLRTNRMNWDDDDNQGNPDIASDRVAVIAEFDDGTEQGLEAVRVLTVTAHRDPARTDRRRCQAGRPRGTGPHGLSRPLARRQGNSPVAPGFPVQG